MIKGFISERWEMMELYIVKKGWGRGGMWDKKRVKVFFIGCIDCIEVDGLVINFLSKDGILGYLFIFSGLDFSVKFIDYDKRIKVRRR